MDYRDLSEGDLSDHLARAREAIVGGNIICAPLENSYIYLVDAFFQHGVAAMHDLRNDPDGVAAQVLIPSIQTLDGIAREFSAEARKLMEAFWPGKISFILPPNQGLNWDLGDHGKLDKFSVRVPTEGFVLELLKLTGPLAIASATFAGQPRIRTSDEVFVNSAGIEALFDAGELPEGAATTVIECDQAGYRLIREGAISQAEITSLLSGLPEQ